MDKIIMYATSDKGDGKVMKVGEYETIEEITILCGMFAPDVQISFEYKFEDNKK